VDETALLVRDRGDEGGYSRAVEASPSSERSTTEVLGELLSEVSAANEKASVLVLGRYNFLLRDVQEQVEVPSNVSLSLSTVHRAKGLEADFVVILAVVSGPYGFPSEIDDDPILDLVLASNAEYPNAEERRLFYVAMTRARSKVFVITRDETRSAFVEELKMPDYAGLVLGAGTSSRAATCPECGGATLTLHQGKHGPYLKCAHDRCRGRAQRCPRCRTDGLVRGSTMHECVFCSYAVDNVPTASLDT
jgi:DNA helicase-4